MTLQEMEDLLERLGINPTGTRGSEVQARCPGHLQRTGHEDRNPSWSINADTGAHICFSCQFRGGLPFLVSYVRGGSYEDAKQWLQDGGTLTESFNKVTEPKEVFEELLHITEAALAAFVNPPIHALKSRGIRPESAEHYQVLWDARRENWILPIRNPYTRALMGWQEKGYTGRFFRNYPTGIKKSEALFGYDKFEGGTMIVVESPLDVVRLHTLGVHGGVATFGSVVSREQINLIRGANKIIFAMDADEAGVQASLHLLKESRTLGFEAWFLDYTCTDMKDVGGMSQSEVQQCIANARHSLTWSAWETV